MIKEALEYIVGMKTPVLNEIGGQIYSDKRLERISFNPKANSIKLNTLSSLVDYIKNNPDGLGARNLIIHIASPTNVFLFSDLDCERKREYIIECKAEIPDFMYGYSYPRENFNISLQSVFADYVETDRKVLLKFVGTVETGTVAEYGDDGVSQKATIKTGIASKGDALVPNPVKLAPYRTFVEVDQPISDFIFRMSQGKDGDVKCTIYEADGGAWKNRAMQNIKTYLETELECEINNGNFVVLA